MIRIVLVLLVCAATANAAPPSRVLVADPDPELARAIDKSLAPWKITVIAEPSVPTEAHAHARADAVDAQFIVWRERGQLVVFDREHGTSERRAALAGTFDPVSAAAAALTVKTMLRLPPPPPLPDETGGSNVVVVAPRLTPPPATPIELRTQVGLGARVPSGDDTGVGGRALITVLVRPTTLLGLRLGLAADLGTSSSVSKSGFKGTFGDWAVLAVASWGFGVGPLEVAPLIGAGATRTTLDGELAMTQSTDSATLPLLRGGIGVRWPLGAFSVGAAVHGDVVLGTPTYMKSSMGMGNPQTIFEVPGSAVVVGVFAAFDLAL